MNSNNNINIINIERGKSAYSILEKYKCTPPALYIIWLGPKQRCGKKMTMQKLNMNRSIKGLVLYLNYYRPDTRHE
jgi:hypothetical protein